MEHTRSTSKEHVNNVPYGKESVHAKEYLAVFDYRQGVLHANDDTVNLFVSESANTRALEQIIAKEECAQDNLIKTMESRKTRARTQSGDLWLSAVEGERPPLGGTLPFSKLYGKVVDFEGSSASLNTTPSNNRNSVLRRPPPISKRSATVDGATLSYSRAGYRAKSSTSMLSPKQNGRKNQLAPLQGASPLPHRHRRTASRAQIVLDSIQEKASGVSVAADFPIADVSVQSKPTTSLIERDGIQPSASLPRPISRRSGSVCMSETNELLAHALVDNDNEKENYELPPPPPPICQDIEEAKIEYNDDNDVPTFSQQPQYDSMSADIAVSEDFPLLQFDKKYFKESRDSFDTRESSKISEKLTASLHRSRLHNKNKSQRLKRFFLQYCNISFLVSQTNEMFRRSYFIRAAIPLCITASILFYFLGNPRFYFLPGEVTLAWWLNLFGRQCVTLELARVAQFILIDCIMLRTRTAVPFLGPFVTLCCIQSRGWPFVLSTWSILDLFLLHGNDNFQLHWFYFTKIQFYTQVNSGNYILASGLYLRILLSMLLAGLACTVKRSLFAVLFGRRTFSMFKPRLESILKEVVLLSEVAELAAEANRLLAPDGVEPYGNASSRKANVPFADLTWTYDKHNDPTGINDDLTVSSDSLDSRNLDELDNGENRCLENCSQRQNVKDLLEKWEEPVGKIDKSLNTSIRDILKFRRALTFLDDLFPFGEAFGPASSRDQVLDSAETVYHRLLKMCPEHCNLSYEVFDILIDRDDGKLLCDAKKKSLKRLFRPDANREISALSFLQGCDGLYKKLCFFRASVGNASVIDEALEEILNGFFYFILVLVVLSILKINPWPLLVSTSTLLVSFSFALGSSASKFIEGIMLIAVRRPYDLGDRVYMLDPSNATGDAIGLSWYIEDINLFYTTVRYASSNEVATLSNGSIANLRIVNANRSPNAVVTFQFPVHISIVAEKKDKMELLCSALDKYVREHPNHWKCFVYCRVNELRVELEQAILGIGLQHQCSWQDLGRILQTKADLFCYLFDASRSLGVNYQGLPDRGIMYYGGKINNGDDNDYRVNLTNAKNVETPKGHDINTLQGLYP